MIIPAGLQLRYLPGSNVSHYVDVPNLDPRAVCGVSVVDFFYWHGSGSQYEVERAQSLAVCKRCVRNQEQDWSR